MLKARLLEVGDRVAVRVTVVQAKATATGVVEMANKDFVAVQWTNSPLADIIARTSPLWAIMELEK